MPMTRSQFGDLFLERLANLEEVIFNRHERYPSQKEKYFQIRTTNRSFVNYTGVSPLGLFEERDEGVNAHEDQVKQLFNKALTPVSYALAVRHTEETMEDDDQGIFDEMNGLLGDAAGQSDDILAADLANQGDTNGAALYLAADGQNIFDASHLVGQEGTTTSNLLTAADLSMTSIQSALVNLEDTVDDRGNLQMIIGNKLVVPTELRFLAAKLIKSSDDPETAERSISPLVDDPQLRYDVWRHLTDPSAFYMWSDYPMRVPGWIWLIRKDLDLDTDVNILNRTAVVVANKRLAYGVIEWRGVNKTPAV